MRVEVNFELEGGFGCVLGERGVIAVSLFNQLERLLN